jgi:hypothetical protein
MHRLIVVVLAILLAFAAVADPKERPSKLTIHEDYLWSEPSSMTEMKERATVIVHVRTNSSRVRAIASSTSPGSFYVRTEHESVVLDVYKNSADHRLTAGDKITILQCTGTYETIDFKQVVNGDAPYPAGDELVLLVRWNPFLGGFEEMSPWGTFRITDKRVFPMRDLEGDENRRGWQLERLADVLRDRGSWR